MSFRFVFRTAALWGLLAACCSAWSQVPQPAGAVGREPLQPVAVVRERLQQEPDRAARLARLRKDIQPILVRHAAEPEWLVSRLQMYWQARHTQVFVKDSLYSHATGQAPVPTVRFTGSRDTATDHRTPRLEDVKPYMGERDRLWLQRKDPDNAVWEWVEQTKTGRIIESINQRVAEVV